MIQASDKRGDLRQALIKIILLLGLALAGVAAIAAEPAPTDTAPATTACAKTSFEFGGRIVQNGEATDTWTLTCWRQPAPEAAAPAAKPVDATAVGSRSLAPPGRADGPPRF